MENSQVGSRTTLRTHSDFQRVFKEGTRIFRNGLGFCIRKVALPGFRFGLSVPKRFGKAVERNRVRRQLKEIIRLAGNLPEAAEVVFLVNRPCCQLSFQQLKDICNWAFKKIQRVKNPLLPGSCSNE